MLHTGSCDSRYFEGKYCSNIQRVAEICFIQRYARHSSLQTKYLVKNILQILKFNKIIYIEREQNITATFPLERDLMLQMLGAAHNDSEDIRIRKVCNVIVNYD